MQYNGLVEEGECEEVGLAPLRANASTGVTLLSVIAPACNEMVWGRRGSVKGWVWHPLTLPLLPQTAAV